MAARTATKAVTPAAAAPSIPNVEQRLRALGYVASSVTRAAMEERPRGDPKDTIGLYNLLKLAAQRLGDGQSRRRHRQGAAGARRRPGGHRGATRCSATCTRRRAGATDAIDAYQRALAVDPEHEGAAWGLALAYKAAGKDDEAEAGFERACQLNPRGAKPLYQLADLADAPQDFAEAARLLEQGLTLDADRPAFLVKLAEARIEMKQLDAGGDGAARGDRDQAGSGDGALQPRARPRGARRCAGRRCGVRGRDQAQPEAVAAALQPGEAARRQRPRAEAVRTSAPRWTSNPEFGTGYLYLAKALLDTGNLAGAEQAALRGLELEPGSRDRARSATSCSPTSTRGTGREAEAKQQVRCGPAEAERVSRSDEVRSEK